MKTIFSFIAIAACTFMVSCSGCNKTEVPVEAPIEVIEVVEEVVIDSLTAATVAECTCETCECAPCECAGVVAGTAVAKAE